MSLAPNKKSFLSKRKIGAVAATAIWLSLLVVASLQRVAINDWIQLRNYSPPSEIASLASIDTMTPTATHLFYLNKPQLESKASFAKNCPVKEQTIVVGCYHGGEQGIYILSVTDSRLSGIEQVTAAHEMLHAAYERLSSSEKQHVNKMLLNYYNSTPQSEHIRDTIAAYRKTEPNEVVNEMHSVFGTEIANLPTDLESYYSRYFTKRSVVTTFAAGYQSEFISREQEVASFDKQLGSTKALIQQNQAELNQMFQNIQNLKSRMDQEMEANNVTAYNANVPIYNSLVANYNTLIGTTRSQIDKYNQTVEQRNSIALEEQQLVEAISSVPVTPVSK